MTILRRVTALVPVLPALNVHAKAPLQRAVPLQTQTAPRQMTLADQWSKIASVLVRSVEGCSTVKDMQSAATQQLDLAQYGLSTLVDELAAVMAMPGVSANRRSLGATVHPFGSTAETADARAAATKDQALAA